MGKGGEGKGERVTAAAVRTKKGPHYRAEDNGVQGHDSPDVGYELEHLRLCRAWQWFERGYGQARLQVNESTKGTTRGY